MIYAGAMTDTTYPAGDFSSWLAQTRKGGSADVPCGDCNACCRSAYFIHIQPHEAAALARIPQELRVQAPGQPVGNFVMGFNDAGGCPMLHNDSCSIYEDRPQTCRDYDCRIFAACGIAAGGEDKYAVNTRVARWRFDYPTDAAEREQKALSAAVEFLQGNGELFTAGTIPDNSTQLALLAISACHLLLGEDSEPQELAAAITEIMRHRQSFRHRQ